MHTHAHTHTHARSHTLVPTLTHIHIHSYTCTPLKVPVEAYAQYCHKRVEKMAQSGAKKGVKKPSVEEIVHAKVTLLHR